MAFAQTASLELARLTEVNEAAKELRQRSYQVSLLALNAMVQSRRAGADVPAFAEVAAQMRGWSTGLCAVIDRLVTESTEGVALVSHLLERERIRHFLTEALRQARRETELGGVTARVDAEIAHTHERLDKTRTTLSNQLYELSRSGLMACVLGRSAMIEAARVPGEREAGLTHVAREFSASGAASLEVIKALRRQTEMR